MQSKKKIQNGINRVFRQLIHGTPTIQNILVVLIVLLKIGEIFNHLFKDMNLLGLSEDLSHTLISLKYDIDKF